MVVTPRERVLTALSHQQPDVTPWQIDLTIDARRRTAEYLGDPDFEAKIEEAFDAAISAATAQGGESGG